VSHWRSADENFISIHNLKCNLTWSEKCMPLAWNLLLTRTDLGARCDQPRKVSNKESALR